MSRNHKCLPFLIFFFFVGWHQNFLHANTKNYKQGLRKRQDIIILSKQIMVSSQREGGQGLFSTKENGEQDIWSLYNFQGVLEGVNALDLLTVLPRSDKGNPTLPSALELLGEFSRLKLARLWSPLPCAEVGVPHWECLEMPTYLNVPPPIQLWVSLSVIEYAPPSCWDPVTTFKHVSIWPVRCRDQLCRQ